MFLLRCSREKPDALFMDVHLGGQSGMKILEAIRNNPETARGARGHDLRAQT